VVHDSLARDQKKAAREGRTIVWVDEAGFYLLAGAVQTYAPRGQTPVLLVPLTRDHLSVIGGLTSAGRLLLNVQTTAFKGAAVVRFLRHLLQCIGAPLVVIWDGGPIHHDHGLTSFLAGCGAERLVVEQLPGYAPDLMPLEGVWHYLKHVELRNVCCHNQPELRHELQLATARLRHKSEILRACIRQCGY
jgi:transposase